MAGYSPVHSGSPALETRREPLLGQAPIKRILLDCNKGTGLIHHLLKKVILFKAVV